MRRPLFIFRDNADSSSHDVDEEVFWLPHVDYHFASRADQSVRDRTSTCDDPRQILHPAKAGIQDGASLVVEWNLLEILFLHCVILSGRKAVKDLARIGKSLGPSVLPTGTIWLSTRW
jgi:hypothetical protein